MVERYEPWDFLNGAEAGVLPCEDGRFVEHFDYEALERENVELRAKLKLALAEREFWRLADKNSVKRAEAAEADRARLGEALDRTRSEILRGQRWLKST